MTLAATSPVTGATSSPHAGLRRRTLSESKFLLSSFFYQANPSTNIAINGYDLIIDSVSRDLIANCRVEIDCGINPLSIQGFTLTRRAAKTNADMLLRGIIPDQIAAKCGFAIQARIEIKEPRHRITDELMLKHLFVIIEPKLE